jgi:cell division septum initiation protein DivIVA
MSDLAPFVAAVMKDKAVEGLLEENKRLENKVQQLQTKLNANQHYVEITGPGGTLIYAEANEHLCLVDGLNTCWARDLLDIELWIAGEKVTTIQDIAKSEDKLIRHHRTLSTIWIARPAAEPKELKLTVEIEDAEDKESVIKALTNPSDENRERLTNCAGIIIWEDIDLHTKDGAPTEYCSLEREWQEFSDNGNDEHENDV